jgi:hypothetical protein
LAKISTAYLSNISLKHYHYNNLKTREEGREKEGTKKVRKRYNRERNNKNRKTNKTKE